MAGYDYGLRGTYDTAQPRLDGWERRAYDDEAPRDRRGRSLDRPTVRYSEDYSREGVPDYRTHSNPYGGDTLPRVIGETGYFERPISSGGTRRPAPPARDDRGEFGPRYGRRYTDEI